MPSRVAVLSDQAFGGRPV